MSDQVKPDFIAIFKQLGYDLNDFDEVSELARTLRWAANMERQQRALKRRCIFVLTGLMVTAIFYGFLDHFKMWIRGGY